MVAREIVWSVSKDALTITPNAPQRGAVQGEHNVTKVVFNIPDDCVLLGDDLKLYIGCTDSTGGYDKTKPLNVSNGRVEYLLPRAWTQYGGTDVLELTAEKADQIVYSVKARVVFESRPGTKKGEKKLLEGFMQAACDAAAESAERAAASEQAAADYAVVSAQNKSLTEQAARFAEERAASAAAASSDASAAANHASNFARQAQQFSENAAAAQNAAETSATRAEAAAAVAEQHAETVSAGVSAATNAANSAATDAAKAKASEEAADNARQAAEEMAEDAAGDAAIATKAAREAKESATQANQSSQRSASIQKALSDDITTLSSEVLNGYIVGDHKNPATNTWLETGSWRTTVIPVNTIVSLTRAVLNTNTISAYAVSFYSSDNISADSFISGLLFNGGGPEEFTDIVIPSNAVIAVFCDRVNHDNIVGDFTSVIEGVAKHAIKNVYKNIDNAVAELSAEIDNVGEEINLVKSHITVPLTLDEATATRDCYINSDGTPTNTAAWRSYLFDVSEVGGTLVSASVYSNSQAYYSISFYREKEIASEHLISGVLVSDTTIKTDFTDVPIPAGTKLVVISSRRNSGTDETAEVQVYAMAAMSKEIEGLAEKVREMDEATSALDDRVKKLEEESGEDLIADIETLRNEKPVDLMTDDFKFGNYYINSSGKMTASGSWGGYAVAATYPKIVFNGYTNSANNSVVGFYASDVPSDDAFISSLNVTPAASVQEIIIDKGNTPEGTKSILFCTRVASGSDSSLLGVTTIVEQVNGLLDDVEKLQSGMDEIIVGKIIGKGNIKTIYRDVPNNNDFAIIGDEIWFNQDGADNSPVHRYKITDDGLVPIARFIPTDFGHWNTVDYCAENDCLVFGNAANDTNTEGNFFSVVPNPRAITGSTTLADCAIRYPVDIGYKVQAVWGDTNLGKNNVVYLFANNAQSVVKVMLKQNEDGSFYKNPDTGEGEYTVLETAEQATNIGVGGGDFWGDTLYVGDGVHHGWYEMSMSDYTVKHIKKNFYRDDGTVISGCTQGIHVDSDYLWVYYNVKYSEQERSGESYLIQYYR